MISVVFRHFGGLFSGTSITGKRFYMFVNSPKLPWKKLWSRVAELIRDKVSVDGRLLVGLDDTTYGKTGRKISGCGTHFDHAAKANSSRWVFGHCRVLAGLIVWCRGRWACLPMGQRNYVRQKEMQNARDDEHVTQWEKTKNGMAAALLQGVGRLFGMPMLVVCDS